MDQRTNVPRRSPRQRRVVPAMILIGLISTGSIAFAIPSEEDSNAAETAAARSLAVEGLRLAEAGRCSEAIDKLARAERLHHAPIVLGRLGECQIAEGKLVDGTEALRRLLREPIPASPPANLLKARERAQSALDAAKGKIAVLFISVKGPRDELTVSVDGQPMSTLLLDSDRPTDPGDHLIEASAPGYVKALRRVTIGPGEKQELPLELRPDPRAPARPPPAPSVEPAATARSPESATHPAPSQEPSANASDSARNSGSPNHTAAYVSWVAGAAILGVGAGFGAVAMNDTKELDKLCPGKVCPASEQGRFDSANTVAAVSTTLVAVGAAGVVLGTVLYFAVGRGSKSDSASPPLRTRAWVGLGQVGLSGEF